MVKKQKTEQRVETLNFDIVARDLFDESDRGCVLVATALIEDLLEMAFKAHFRSDGTRRSDLFEGQGPLSSLSNKIELAYFLELIDDRQRSGLHLLRKIRNDCAHLFEPIVFDSDRMKKFYRKDAEVSADRSEDTRIWVTLGIPQTPRSRFVDRVISHCAALLAITDITSERKLDESRYLRRNVEASEKQTAELKRMIAEYQESKTRGG